MSDEQEDRRDELRDRLEDIELPPWGHDERDVED